MTLYIEAFSCAKDSSAPATNEDQMAVVPGRLYAVADGATDISGRRYDDRLGLRATGGRLASRAVIQALYELAHGAGLPEPSTVLDLANREIAEIYQRLEIASDSVSSGEHRFCSTFAAVFIDGDTARVVCIGDCGVRINSREILRHDFPADSVFAAARAIGWELLSARGVAVDEIRRAARQLIVKGLAGEAPEPFTSADLAVIRDAVLAHRALGCAAQKPELIARALDGGLRAVRADPDAFDAGVPDGVSDLAGRALVRDVSVDSIETIEVFSDGYPMIPEKASVAAWEAALEYADATDPERIGEFASTKGRAGALFGDDRTIVIAKSRRD